MLQGGNVECASLAEKHTRSAKRLPQSASGTPFFVALIPIAAFGFKCTKEEIIIRTIHNLLQGRAVSSRCAFRTCPTVSNRLGCRHRRSQRSFQLCNHRCLAARMVCFFHCLQTLLINCFAVSNWILRNRHPGWRFHRVRLMTMVVLATVTCFHKFM